jgi:hypothetical protein
MLIEVLEGSIEVVRHLDQAFGAPELSALRRDLNRHKLDGLLVATSNEDCLSLVSSTNQFKQPLFRFVKAYLFNFPSSV